jgi:hypothetical protein
VIRTPFFSAAIVIPFRTVRGSSAPRKPSRLDISALAKPQDQIRSECRPQ